METLIVLGLVALVLSGVYVASRFQDYRNRLETKEKQLVYLEDQLVIEKSMVETHFSIAENTREKYRVAKKEIREFEIKAEKDADLIEEYSRKIFELNQKIARDKKKVMMAEVINSDATITVTDKPGEITVKKPRKRRVRKNIN